MRGLIKGYVDNIGNRFISGWVMREGQKGPVWVQVWVNGKKIRAAKAVIHRRDIFSNKIHSSGNCGFHFKNLRIRVKDTVVVKVGAEQIKLPFTNNVTKWIEGNHRVIPTKDCYFFLHIPKTAGTSFRAMLNDIFKPWEILPNTTDIAGNGGLYPMIYKLLRRKRFNELTKIKIMLGHYPYRPKTYFENAPVVLTFLRDPFKRAVSRLFHMKINDSRFKDQSLTEIYEQNPIDFINLQVHYISGYTGHINQLGNDQLEIAKQNLKSFAFCGITSRFEESVELLENTFNWKFKEQSLTKNVNKKYSIDEVPSELIEKIKAVNQLDQKLYEFGLELFEQKLADLRTK